MGRTLRCRTLQRGQTWCATARTCATPSLRPPHPECCTDHLPPPPAAASQSERQGLGAAAVLVDVAQGSDEWQLVVAQVGAVPNGYRLVAVERVQNKCVPALRTHPCTRTHGDAQHTC